MSEFELNLTRQRCQEAIRQKAQRGELQFALPVGFRWTANGKVEKDPDLRIQQAIENGLREDGRVWKCTTGLAVVLWRESKFACMDIWGEWSGTGLEAADLQHDLAHASKSDVSWRLGLW